MISVLSVLIIYCALLGLIVGSFLNVVIYRVPRQLSVVRPRSACPTCAAPIAPRDNVPLVSWLVLHGRCRHCATSISIRYPLVEVSTALLFAGAAARFGYHAELPAMLILLAGLLALAVIDAEQLLLPRRVVYPMTVMLVVALAGASAVDNDWHRLLVAAIAGASWYTVFFLINLASPRSLGFGDVRLALPLGFGLGWLGPWYAVLGFFAANLIGAVIGVLLIATKRIARRQPIPYGVFLALGAAVAVYAGEPLLTPLQHLQWHVHL